MDMVDQATTAATKAAAGLQSDEAASKAYVSPIIKTGDRQLDRELADERNRKCVDCGGSKCLTDVVDSADRADSVRNQLILAKNACVQTPAGSISTSGSTSVCHALGSIGPLARG